MSIGHASKLTGISIDTLRYYEKLGIINIKRNGTLRNYSEDDIEMIS